MKVGDLIKHKQTGKIGIVRRIADEYGAHFWVYGWPSNQVFNSTTWERLSEGR